MEADGPSLVALNVMFEELIKTDGLPKDEILSSLNKFSHSVSIINSLLFFAYVDCNKEEEAALLIQVSTRTQYTTYSFSNAFSHRK